MRNIQNTLSAIALAAATATMATAADADTVNVYFWNDYLPPAVLDGFKEATGLTANYIPFESLEALQTKLLAGNSNYDVVLPAAINATNMIQAGALQKLDKSLLPNRDNVSDWAWQSMAAADPGNEYGVPYFWGTTGLAYEAGAVAERMPDAPTDSWDMLFDPEVASKFESCGIAWIDSPEQVISAALNYMGFDPFTTDADEIAETFAMLKKVRPYVRRFDNLAVSDGLANGNFCLTFTWSGDAALAQYTAAEAGRDVDIRYTIPREGTDTWFDFASIPVDAPNPEGAHAFLNYLMTPEAMAAATNSVYYANAVPGSLDMITDEVKNDPGIYPPQEVLDNLYPNRSRDLKTLRRINRAWTELKSEQ